MSLIQMPCTAFIMQYLNHILIIALKYGEILIKTIPTQYLFYKKVIQIVCHARSLDLTSQIFCPLYIFKIYDLIDFNACMYKVFHKLVPSTLQNKFSMSSSKKYTNNFCYVCKNRKKAIFNNN